ISSNIISLYHSLFPTLRSSYLGGDIDDDLEVGVLRQRPQAGQQFPPGGVQGTVQPHARRTVDHVNNLVAARGNVEKGRPALARRSEEHTSELQSLRHLVCRLLL